MKTSATTPILIFRYSKYIHPALSLHTLCVVFKVRIRAEFSVVSDYLLSILLTGRSHRYNHHLTRGEPQWPETQWDTFAFNS